MKEQILSQLSPVHPWRDQIQYFDIVDSTNTRAKELALSGAPHGTVLIANCQTGGRGRLGRTFHSREALGVYMSVLLRPACSAQQLMHLTCAAAVAACDAVEKAVGIRPGIKWTNDLVWGKQKLAGILTELVHTGSGCCAIVGIGINCLHTPDNFPEDIRHMAASLSVVTGKPVDRAAVAAALIETLQQMDQTLLSGKETMLAYYRADCVTLGQEVCVVTPTSTLYAVAEDVDGQGALIVRFADGSRKTVSSGEVSIRGMYGYI